MLEGMQNGTTKSGLLENCGIKNLFQNKVGEWLIGIGFKYDIVVDYLYVDVH